MSLIIKQLDAFSDNYIYLLKDTDSDACAVVDPGDEEPVLEALKAEGWTLTHVLATHHHPDHVGGVEDLKRETGCKVIGARIDNRIPLVDQSVGEGDMVSIGANQATVFEVPGHTSGHIAYWFADAKALFCGDTLFSLGCGRLFEGSPAQMWDSLGKLRLLPDDTRVFCAHEYTQSNARFARAVDPDNGALKARADEIDRLRAKGERTVPSLLGEEKRINPFLRADAVDLQAALGMEGRPAVEVFAEVRQRKDNF